MHGHPADDPPGDVLQDLISPALGLLYLLSIAAALGLASLADAGALLLWLLLDQPPSPETLQDPSFSDAALIATLATAPVPETTHKWLDRDVR